MSETVDTRIAGVILVDAAGRLLLQLRDGNTTRDPHRWSLPRGHVEPGEDPLDCAHRELLEETGLQVEELHLFWQGLAPSATFPGAIGEFTIFYAATDRHNPGRNRRRQAAGGDDGRAADESAG